MAWTVSDLYPMRRRLCHRPLRNVKLRLEALEQRLAPTVNVLNWGYGSSSTLVNPNETVLTPTNVKVGSFGKLSTTNVDGQVYAQPLIDQGITIGASGGDSTVNIVGATGTQNVVFVATEHDSLYAINDNPGSGAILWQRSFTNLNANYVGTTVGTNINNTLGASTITSVPNGDVNSSDISPEIGISGTPVIDPSTNTIYVLVKTKETISGTAHYVQRLHAINISDGTDKMVPFLIGDTYNGNTNNTQIFVYGTGDGNVTDPNRATDGNPGTTIVQFNALREANRPALTIENGQLYAAWASHGDNGPYHGWVVTWKLSGSFTLAGWFCTSPNDGLAGIWSGGTTLQFESDGTTFYFETGNGSGGAPTLNAQGFPTNANYNEALVKVVADSTTSMNHQGSNGWGMKVADYFIPYNVAALDSADSDFGSGAPLLLPPSAGIPNHPNLMVAAGKAGTIYLIDRNNMGKFNSVNDNVINSVNDGSGHLEPPNLISGSISTPAYFNGELYWVSGYSGSAYAYTISSNGTISATSQTSATFGYLPGSVVVSANGTNNGIVWVMDRNLNEIHAYSAATFSTELWNSNMAAGGGDSVGAVNKMTAPTEANGEVFVGTATALQIYGPSIPANAAPNAPVLSATTLSGTSVNLTWTDSTTAPNTATGYSIEDSTDNVHFSVVTTTPAGSTSVALGGLQPLTTYYFRIRGFNSFGGLSYSPYSNTASATTTNETPFINFPNGFANTSGLTLNGATLDTTTSSLEITNANNGAQANSAFSTNVTNVGQFSTLFNFQITPAAANIADGFTFTIQANTPTVVGANGGGLGYQGINNSIAIKFDLYSNNGEGVDSTGLYTNGAVPQNVGSMDLTSSGVNLHSGDIFQCVLTYDGTTLTETIKDTNTGASDTINYTINIPGTIGGTNAYAGFTGGCGGETATQEVRTWTFTPGPTVSPNAPTGLGATVASATSVTLNWTNNATTQAGFHLDRATDSAFTQNLITETLPGTPNTYTDTATGLAPGGTYYYRIRAYNGAGDSGNSNVSSVMIPLPPPTPTNLQVVAVSTTEIDLQWTDNAGHNCQGYHVYRATNGGSLGLIATLPPTSRTAPDPYGFNDTTVSPGNNYNYHIVCFNVSGNNDFAGANLNSLTNPPSGVTTVGGNGTVSLSWTAPMGAASYNVYRGASPGSESLLTNVTGTAYTDSSVSNGAVYYYKVTALNGNPSPIPAESAASSEVPATPAILPTDTVGVAYNQTIAATWGSGSKTLSVGSLAGAIPGLNVPASGTNSLTITGTPTAAGTETFSVTATDTTGTTTTTNYSITVNPAVGLSPGTLPVDTAGVAYGQTISTSGGSGTIQLAVSNITGAIPGLTVPTTGTGTLPLSGTPTASGTETFKVTATDSLGATTSATYSITVNPAVALSPGPLAADTIGVAYNQTITASGGTGSLSLAVTNLSGAIAGLTVPTSGAGSLTISGTPSATGTETFTVTATDSLGGTATTNYTITINRVVTLSPGSLPFAPVNVPYSQTINASGGTGNVTLAVSNLSGSIPGLTIPTSGTNALAITGTPTATGTVTFTLTATDSVGESGTFNYSVTINPASAFLSMPGSGYSGQTNSTLMSYPISISQLADVASPTKHVGLSAADLVLTFPTGEFNFPVGGNLATPYVSLGSIPLSDTAGTGGVNDWTLTANSSGDGKLSINLQARTGDNITTNTGGGTLVYINFPILPAATLGNVPLTLAASSGGIHTQIVGTNGVYTLSPAPPYAGSVTITQGPQNPPSVPATESYKVETNSSLSVAAPGLLTGATDPNTPPESLTVGTVNGSAANVGSALTLASGATLTVQSNGSFVYTPPSNFVGPDSFTFQAEDAGKSFSNTSTVTITMTPTLSLVPLGTATSSPGQTITEQVVLDNPNPSGGKGPLSGFNLALTYDSGVLTVASVNPGSSLPGDWTPSLNTSTSGVIAFASFGSGSGSDLVSGPAPLVLATISFTINSVSPQTTQVDLVPSANVGTTTTSTSITGSGGTFPLNPALSSSYLPGVDATINVVMTTVHVNPGSLPAGEVNVVYGQTLSGSGGTGPYTFAVTSGTLPPGLSLTSGGVLSGTPTSTSGSPYNFTITATDAGSQQGSQSYSVTIDPALSISTTTLPNWTVSKAGYSQTISAAGGTGSYTFAATGTLPTGLSLSSAGVLSGTPSAAGIYSFTVTASDGLGGHASQNYTVVVNPAVGLAPGSLPTGLVNTAYNQTITASGGTGNKALAVSGISGAIAGLNVPASGTNTLAITGTPTASGTETFTVTATDSVGATAMTTYSITVYYPATTLVLTAPSGATAGSAFTVTITATDGSGHTAGGFNGVVTLSSSSGPDVSPTSVTLTNGTAMVPVTLSAAGSQTLTAAASGLTSANATINVAAGPFSEYLVSTVLGGGSIAAGNYFLVTVQAADSSGNPITNYTGPSTVTATVNPSSSFSNFPLSISIGSNGFGYGLATLQKVGTYTITAASGSFTGTSSPLTVVAGPAAKLAFVAQPVGTPTGDVLPHVTIQVQDAYGNLVTSDNTDAVTVGIASGPGGFTAGSTTTASAHGGVATFSNLTLIKPGSYTLSEVVPTLYTGPNSTVFNVAPLQVVPGSLTNSATGFSLQFNAPFLVNSLTPVLYGTGFGASAPVPSVTLTQTKDAGGHAVNVPVAGSVVLNTATNSLTFVATDTALETDNGFPVLPSGTYTVDLTSSVATDGFQALNSGGGFLDGLGSGTPGSGDYQATFTLSTAGDDVLWVPATADGPGQPLNAPGGNQANAGYPIYLSDTTGSVSNVQVTLNYNPALLTVTGVSGAHFTLLGSSTPGHAVLQYSGPALPTGTQTAIGFVTAMVPGGTAANPTPYKAKDLLHLSGVSLNSGTISATIGDALHLVAYVGDADGNGAYSSNDAVLITRAAIQVDTGFTAYPLVDPVIVADTDGAGFIPADAALQVNEAGVGFPTSNLPNPPIPSGVVFQPIANNVDPSVSIPTGLQANEDGILTVPVNLDDPHPAGSTGLIEAHLALTYDPRQYSVSAADIHLGSVLAQTNGWSATPTINAQTGEIAIALSSTTPITSTLGGSLVTIDLHVNGGVRGEGSGVSADRPSLTPDPWALTPILLVAFVNPTGTQVVRTELEDAQGTFTLTPAPISGVVSAAAPAASFDTPVVISTRSLPAVEPTMLAAPETSLPEPETPVSVTTGPEESDVPHPLAAPSPLAPLSGFVLQVALPSPAGVPGVAAWLGLQHLGLQHLVDQAFQSLTRGSSIDQILTSVLLPGSGPRPVPLIESVDAFNLEESFGDFGESWAAPRPHVPPPEAAQPALPVEEAAVDQYFAQTANDFDTDLGVD